MLLLLLLSRFSHVRLCATPQTATHQAPLWDGGGGCNFLSAKLVFIITSLNLRL